MYYIMYYNIIHVSAYNDDNQLIPRNADVTVKRIPTGNKVSKSQLAAQ